jgi:type I restriction enzyme S subunit
VRSAALIKPFKNYINIKFLSFVMQSPLVQCQIIEKSRSTAQANLFLGKIRELIVVVPPLNEQNRIVSKVDRLLSLCDRLTESLQNANSKREKLFQAVVNQVQEFKNKG